MSPEVPTRAAVVLAFLATAACGRPAGVVDLRLDLEVEGDRLGLGEQPWYLLRMTNVGNRALTVRDRFWCKQSQLIRNSEPDPIGTYFELVDSKGSLQEFNPRKGPHSALWIWDNDPSGRCADDEESFHLAPGESVVASKSIPKVPSLPAPRPTGLGPGRPPSLNDGYRKLEGYEFLPPGRYRLKAVFQAIPQWAIDRDTKERGDVDPARYGWPREMTRFRFESNVVELEYLR